MQWYAMDLHAHTPASKDFQDEDATYLDILKKAEEEGISILGFADHNTVAGYASMMEEIEDLERWEADKRLRPEERERLEEYRRLLDKMLVLPGFELTATFGFHIMAFFDPDTPVRQLEHVLLDLHVPVDSLERGETEVGSTSDVITAYEVMAEAGALVVAAHANSTHGVAMFGINFGGQTRIAYTQDPNLHALEVTDLESKRRRTTASFFNGSKPQYPRRMHCIQGSDSHRIKGQGKHLGVGERATEVLLPELSFDALKELFLSDDFARTRPYRASATQQYDHIEEARKQGPTIVQSFHENMTRRGGCLHAIMCDIVAYANTKGGTIYIGASANQRVKPKGVDNPSQAIRFLREEMERLVTPPMDVKMDALSSQGSDIIRMAVPEGNEKPYVLEGSKIYIRQEAETSLAMRDEIVDLVSKVVVGQQGRPAAGRDGRQREAARQPEKAAQAQQAADQKGQQQQRSAQERRAAEQAESEQRPERANGDLVAEPPRTGVEIDDTVVRKGTQYHTMKDLRDGGLVHNVTRSSARRLWRYAIALKEKGTFSEDKVDWKGDLGLWHKYLRSGRPHYDLVQRDKSGDIHVYYGVSDDGIHGEWRSVIGDEE